jgi:hypothetical protein
MRLNADLFHAVDEILVVMVCLAEASGAEEGFDEVGVGSYVVGVLFE